MENQAELLKEVKAKAALWLSDDYDAETRASVKAMIEAEDPTDLIESFYKDLEFGTGGLRGIMGAGTNRMNIYTVGAATQGLANYLREAFADLPEIKVVVGHDVRNNSRKFAELVANVFSANGIKVYLFEDFRPTPELSFAIRHLGCQSGVNITASHNPTDSGLLPGCRCIGGKGLSLCWSSSALQLRYSELPKSRSRLCAPRHCPVRGAQQTR